MEWQNLKEVWGDDVSTRSLFCTFCNRNRRVREFADLEMESGFLCNAAYKLSCGHLVSSDCIRPNLEGRCFDNEGQLLRGISGTWKEERRQA